MEKRWTCRHEYYLWIVLRAIVGWIASIVMGTNAQQGAVLTIILGIVGAFIGGLLMSFLGACGVNGFNLYSLLVATIGQSYYWNREGPSIIQEIGSELIHGTPKKNTKIHFSTQGILLLILE